MMPPVVFAWLVTLVVEVPCVALWYPGQRRRMAVVCAIATSITNLAMNILLPRWLSPGDTVGFGELGSIGFEALVYALASRPRDIGRALAASGLANGLSFAAGLVLPTTM
jgi:hypothetical protein